MSDRLKEFAASSNGDRWFLGCDVDTGLAYVLHKANEPSGGKATRLDIGTFLSAKNPSVEHEALLRLIGQLARDDVSDVAEYGPEGGESADL